MMIPQQMATIAIVAVGGISVVLSAASVTNIYETYALVKNHPRNGNGRLSSPPSESSYNAETTTSFALPAFLTPDEALEGLSKMKKRELVRLFLHCDSPSASDLALLDDDGDDDEREDWRYDGYLLDNGPILSPVTNFITNRLFGRGQKWLGKAYSKPPAPTLPATSNGASTVMGIGKNRFRVRRQQRKRSDTPPDADELLGRTFNYSVGTSTLPSAASSPTSLFNRYAPHNLPLSSPTSLLWRGMVDELRVVELEGSGSGEGMNEKKAVLLGMGYFTWSGGIWNLAPFCLLPRKLGS